MARGLSTNAPYYAVRSRAMARTRQLVGLVTLLTLIVIALAVTGVELPLPRAGTSQSPPVQGVKAVGGSMLARVGAGAPADGELAFMAIEPSGNLVVTDSQRASVLRFDPTGHLLSEWGPQLGGTELVEPAGVAVFGDNYYVLDRGTPRIFRLDNTGQAQAVLDLQPLSPYGLNGLAVDAKGNIYAADTGRNRILVFSPSGQLLKQIGHSGSDLGGFTQPMMLAFAPDGSFYVADWENSRIERFNSNYEATDSWSVGFRPFGVAVDGAGRVYVPDSDHHRVVVFSSTGAPLGEMGAPAPPTIDVGPKQLAIGPGQPSLYVLGSDGIQRLDLANTPPPPQGGTDLSDLVGVVVLVLILLLLGLAIVARRQRRREAARTSLGAPLDRPVGLHAENGAQRQHQQSQANEDLLVANQAEGKQ
jgi:DNA-binding beta-propeller fold protein YncE